MRKQSTEERRVRLAAGRHGLQLIRRKARAATQRNVYCLRALWDAGHVVSKRPDGGFGYVFAPTSRERTASWLSLSDIEHVLANWSEPAPRARRHRRKNACTTIYYGMAKAQGHTTRSTSQRDGVSPGRAISSDGL